MAIIIGKIKCYFCNGTCGLFHSVHDYGIYGDAGRRIFYHPECLELIEMEPEKYANIMMDKALHIAELREICIKTSNSKIISSFNERVEKLHQKHFERMMPKKR